MLIYSGRSIEGNSCPIDIVTADLGLNGASGHLLLATGEAISGSGKVIIKTGNTDLGSG